MTAPLQFASLYDGQEVFVWSDCLLDLGTDFLLSNMVFIRNLLPAQITTTSVPLQRGYRAREGLSL